ncbi:glycosyltransferase family 9 protein, partial [Burkholderia pseudomallei]|uniref:glycosyltransferase family 9 protein n=1 Tax=Burkholderia pseudomallei TaxID=28450 RepID=UPI00135DAE44
LSGRAGGVCGRALCFGRLGPRARARCARLPGRARPARRPLAGRGAAGGRGGGGSAGGAGPPAADLVCPLLSLPFALGLEYDVIPSGTPYLDVPDAARRRFRGSLGGQAKRKFGIAWSGSAPVQDNRALPLDALAPLFALAGIDWIVLQPTLSDSERAALDAHPDAARIHRLDGLTDFAATAALVDRLDGVVAIDTAVAHLAGALGKPLWLMLPVAADWRWSTGDDSAWYPRARLVRQSEPGRWDDVVATVAGEIAHG